MMKYTDCIVFLLAKANQKAQNNLKTRLKPYGLTPVQHLILEIVWENQGITAGEIGKRMVSDNATVSGVLDRMVEAGWVEKRPDEDDKRVTRIYLAKKTTDMAVDIVDERERANSEILTGFNTEERVLLKRFLQDFI